MTRASAHFGAGAFLEAALSIRRICFQIAKCFSQNPF